MRPHHFFLSKLPYDWEVPDRPSVCVWGDIINVDRATMWKRGGFPHYIEQKDLEAELLRTVCNDVEIEADERLDIVGKGFWERRRSAFFDARICYSNADSYRDTRYSGSTKQREAPVNYPSFRSRASCTHAITFQNQRRNGSGM